VKKILALLLLVSGFSLAQEPIVADKSVVCSETKVVLETLRKTYKEEPVWLGKGNDRSSYSLFINPKTGAFTLVQFNSDVACVVGTGESSINIPTKSTL